jgi:hypothetical protein
MPVVEELQRLSDARFLQIYQSLENQGFGPLDGEVAKSLNFRPQAIRKLPMAQRAKRARSILTSKRNAELCYELFGSYLIKAHKELVTGFLDATGVKHEDGMLEDLDHNRPDPAKVAGAVAELDGKFAPEDVTLYLALCAEQWPQVPELERLWRARLGAA